MRNCFSRMMPSSPRCAQKRPSCGSARSLGRMSFATAAIALYPPSRMSRARDEIMWEEAYRLARSGDHSNYLSIEWELKGRFRKAHSLLGDERMPEHLDRMF